jgi:hypothetical protein
VFIFRGWPFSYRFHLLGVAGYPLRGHTIHEVQHFLLKELAFLRLEI